MVQRVCRAVDLDDGVVALVARPEMSHGIALEEHHAVHRLPEHMASLGLHHGKPIDLGGVDLIRGCRAPGHERPGVDEVVHLRS